MSLDDSTWKLYLIANTGKLTLNSGILIYKLIAIYLVKKFSSFEWKP
jgi:hypothetical protein